MELKKVCLMLFGLAFFLLLNGISCIANQDYEKNVISEDERRAAEPATDQTKSDSQKRGLYLPSTGHSAKPHSASPYPSDYGHTGSSGSGHAYGPSAHGYGSTGHGLTGYDVDHGSTGLGVSYGHGGGHSSGGGYGYGHSSYGPPSGGGGYGGGGYGGGHSYGHVSHSSGSGGHGHNAYALKGLLIPLAGIALLGAAAALTTNPVLLQLGVVNGRRRKRSLELQDFQRAYPENPHVRPKRN